MAQPDMQRSDQRVPALSVVLTTPDCYETIRTTLGYLRAQTVQAQLEIVIVGPSADQLAVEGAELEGFCGFRVVEVRTINAVGAAYAAGIRQASAPVVALAEDHAYPDPNWAAALIAAHQQPWAAVGPVLRNANPTNAISWADFLISYGPWAGPMQAGDVDHLPGHNSSYKREILLEYGKQLDAMLEAESVLHWDLRARGYRLYIEPAAIVSHMNFARPQAWLSSQFHCGRLFAATRAQGEKWSVLRRFLYTAATPLIPLVRVSRILPPLRRVSRAQVLPPRVLLALLIGLFCDAAGQLLGYALGAGDAKRVTAELEYHRDRYTLDGAQGAGTPAVKAPPGGPNG